MGLFILFFALCLFFLPAILAKGKKDEDQVTLVNVFLGTTGVGWLISLIWALYQGGKLPSGISLYIAQMEKKRASWGKWISVLLGFIFLLIWDCKEHRGHKSLFDFSVFKGAGASFWGIASLKWLPMCAQLLLLVVLAGLLVGSRSIKNGPAIVMTGSFALILFSLSCIKPGAVEYFMVLWGSFFLYSFSVKE